MGKYLIKKLIANKEEKKVVIKPTNSGYKGKVEYSFIELKNSTKDANEIDVLNIINNNDKINNYTKNKKIIKKIFVPNKIINLIIK